jgi:magnesium-transporting ATPase (P-type)
MDATTMFIVLGQHYLNARQVILSARQMAQEVQASVQDTSSLEVLILKRGKRKSSAVELLPGDIFVMSQTADGDLVIPVDALLLDGQGLRFRRRGRRV